MQTVVELKEFQIRAKVIGLTEEDVQDIIWHLAADPTDGVVMQGTGGVRKLRWAAKGRGKSGGARVIHFFGGDDMPLFLLTIFAKSERDNLSKAERNDIRKLTAILKRQFKRKITT